MPTCPRGHDSADTDYCDVCGVLLTPAQAVAQAATPGAGPACPRCGTARGGRFCEACGLDFDAPASSAEPRSATVPNTADPTAPDVPNGWVAVVTVDPAAEQPPAYCPERTFPLDRPEVRIGRSSRSRGLSPEIDLTGPPADNGVSHLHAVLIAQADGSWRLIDPGSTNGTRLNDATDDLIPGDAAPVGDGDAIHLGAWTLITLRKEPR